MTRFAPCRKWSCLVMSLACMPLIAAERVERGEFSFMHEPAPDWVQTRAIAEAWPAGQPGADSSTWRNWLIDTQVDRRGAVPVRYSENVIEARSSELVASAAKFRIDFSPAFEDLSIHTVALRRDGVWHDRYVPEAITLARRESAFESDMTTGAVSALIVVDDVRPNDVVRFAYSLRGENPIMAGLVHDGAFLAWVDPVLERHVRVLLPADAEPATALPDIEVQPQIRRGRDGIEIVLIRHGVPGEAMIEDAPEWHDLFPVFQVSRSRTWADVARWAADLYPDEATQLPQELEQMVEQWRALPDPEARIAAALQLVQDEVRYFSVLLGDSSHRPAPPATTWARRYGDCKDKAWLLSALLRRLDVDAVPALVSSARGKGVVDRLPAATQFDHVIVQVILPSGTIWLDPTLTQQRGPLAERVANDFGYALPVARAAGNLVEIDPGADPGWRTRIVERIHPDPAGRTMRLEVVTTRSGRSAEQFRRDLSVRSAEEIGRDFADYYRRRYGEIEHREPLRIEDDHATGSLTTHEAYVFRDVWPSSPPGSRLLELFADGLEEPLAHRISLERQVPLRRSHPVNVEHATELVLPPGWGWSTAAENHEAGDETFSYRRTIERGAETPRIVHRYRSAADHVTTDQLDRHFWQLRDASVALGLRVTLSTPEAGARTEREQRLRGLLQSLMED